MFFPEQTETQKKMGVEGHARCATWRSRSRAEPAQMEPPLVLRLGPRPPCPSTVQPCFSASGTMLASQVASRIHVVGGCHAHLPVAPLCHSGIPNCLAQTALGVNFQMTYLRLPTTLPGDSLIAPSLSLCPSLPLYFISVLLAQEEAPGLGRAAQMQDLSSLAFLWKTWCLERDTASRPPQR